MLANDFFSVVHVVSSHLVKSVVNVDSAATVSGHAFAHIFTTFAQPSANPLAIPSPVVFSHLLMLAHRSDNALVVSGIALLNIHTTASQMVVNSHTTKS